MMAVAFQAHLPSVTDLCVHAGILPLELELDPTELLWYQLDQVQVCSTCANSMSCVDWLRLCH